MSLTVVVGTYWGDEGKGKITDLMLQPPSEYKIAARYGGGYGTGHTVVIDGKEYAVHGNSVGILTPHVQTVIGRKCLFEPQWFNDELGKAAKLVDFKPPFVSERATITTAYDRILERIWEAGAGQIGTTNKGVGPTYADVPGKVAIKVGYVKDASLLRERLQVAHDRYQPYFEFYKEFLGIDIPEPSKLADELLESFERLGSSIRIVDESSYLRKALANGENVLCEATQAPGLDPDQGTYPFVSAASATSAGVFEGLGLPPQPLDVVQVIKAYPTRVGKGPFPTRIHDEELAAKIRDEHVEGTGGEYGTTSGRARDIGWPDAVAAKYAAELNRPNRIVLTKIDKLDSLAEIPVCTEYMLGDEMLASAQDRHVRYPTAFDLFLVRPHYGVTLKGWQRPTKHIRHREDLPKQVLQMADFYSEMLGAPVELLTNYSERDAFVRL